MDWEVTLRELSTQYGPWVYAALALAIFVQTAVPVGFVVPGNPLVIGGGLVAKAGDLSFGALVITLALAAFAGNLTNYWIGRKSEAVFSRRIPAQSVQKAEAFFATHGDRTVAIALFVPIVRSIVPFLAGSTGMPFARFVLAAALGSVAWIGAFTSVGALFGQIPVVRENIQWLFLALFVAVTGKALSSLLRARAEAVRANG
jgi:membrane-associated protein